MVRTRNRKPTVPRSQVVQPQITRNLVAVIKRVQRELQMSENFSRGRKARKITFIEASQELGRNLKQ